MRTVLLALGALGVAWAQPQTYRLDPAQSFQPMIALGGCAAGNANPQINTVGETFTVNVTCLGGFSAVGTVTFTFSSTTLTGEVSDGILSTPLIVNASATLTYQGGDPTQYNGGLGASGEGSGCGKSSQTSGSLTLVDCSINTLNYNQGTGDLTLYVGLDIIYSDNAVYYSVPLIFTPVATSSVSLVVDHITVEQTVQNDQNYSTPIVAGKSAIVRVFPAVHGTNPVPLTGITGTLSGSGPGGNVGPLQLLPSQSGTVTARAAPIPTNQDDSLNFSLPAQFLAAGTLQLVAQVNPPAGQTGIDTSHNMLNEAVNVVAAPGSGELAVGYLPLPYEPPGLSQTKPTGNIANAYKLLNRVLPIGDRKVIYFPIPARLPTWTSALDRAAKPKFVSTMEKIYHIIDAGAPGVIDQLFVWVPRVYPYNCGDPNAPPQPPKNTRFPIGSSDPMWSGGIGHVAFGQDTTSTLLPNQLPGGNGVCLSYIDKYYLNFTLAHEIGHNLGLRHAAKAPTDALVALACGANVSASTANWPYADSTIQQPGYDPIEGVFKPNTKNDLMSSCAPPGNNIWISPFDYHQLFAGGFSPQLAGPAPAKTSLTPVKRDAVTSKVLIVSGTVSMDGTTGSLDPVYLMPAGGNLDPSDPNGNYCLNLSGAGGTLGRYCFTVNFGDDDPNDPDEEGPPFAERSFAVRIPFPAGTTEVQLAISGTQLASLTATGQAPSVTITSPIPGATWQGSNTISWNASDPTGRSLMYTILYSSDGGKTYLPLSVDQPNPQLSLDTAQITGGSRVYFQVITSAGLDTTTTTAGPITVVQTPQIGVPASLDFGGQGPGLLVDQDLTIMSTGTGPLTISSITINNPAFQIIDPLPSFPIPAGSQVIVTVRFSPSGTGSASGTLTISSNDPARPNVAVPLTAASFAAPVPNIQADASLQFPNTPVGSSESLAFNVTNTGGANLTINSITSSNRVFAVMGTTVPFTLAPNAQQAVMMQFAPTSVGAVTGTVTLASNDPVHPSVSVAMTATAVNAGNGAPGPSITVAPASLNFGATVEQSRVLTVTIGNAGAAPLNITGLSTSAPFEILSPKPGFAIAANASATVTVQLSPASFAAASGTLVITSNDPSHAVTNVALSGPAAKLAYMPHVLMSDSFGGGNAAACSLPRDDLKLGGSSAYYYLPIFPGANGPVGASIVSGALQNNGLNYGGVQLTSSAGACTNLGIRGATLPQDLGVRVDLLVPVTSGKVTDAGPYFRSRAAAAGDGINGGTSSGYWVQLISTGQVRVRTLNPFATLAATAVPASFDPTIVHTLETIVKGNSLQVTLDGQLQTFTQNGASVTSITLPAAVRNDGTVGIGFASEDNPGLAGGQRAANLVIWTPSRVGFRGTPYRHPTQGN